MFKILLRGKYLKKVAIVIAAVSLLVAGGWFLGKKFYHPASKRIYTVAVIIRDQHNLDPAEDARASLKRGDVLVVQPAGHSWSTTESISYLILKMSLTEEQAAKLTQSKEKEIKFEDLSKEEQKRIEEEKRRAKEEGKKYEEEPRQEALIAREYYVDLARDEFKGFREIDLLNGQPYTDKVFDWRIVERK